MSIAFFERGEGDHAVLVTHGFLGSGRNLTSFSQRLSEARPDLHLYICDLPGHGTSEPMRAPETLRSAVEPMAEFAQNIAAKHGAPIACIGHSMGGRVSLCLAAEHPNVVAQAILIDIAPGPIGDRNTDLELVAKAFVSAPATATSRDEMRTNLLHTGLAPSLADWLLMNLRNEQGHLTWRVDRDALIRFGLATRGDDLWPKAEQVGRRFSCIYGERSGFVLPEDVAHMAELGARVIPVDAGHFVHVDALDVLVSHCAKLLR